MVELYPAPWELEGKGYIIIYKFNKVFVDKYCYVPEFLRGSFAGGFGSVMVVDYESSDAGPYGELLFMPGKFHHDDGKFNTITKIYVSTMESVVNGKENWGIPKELAAFNFKEVGENKDQIIVSREDEIIAKFLFSSYGLPFPLNTTLIPFHLVQYHEGKYYYTDFKGKGTAQLSKMEGIVVNEQLFPDVSLFKPVLIIKVDPFSIEFPEAEIKCR
ncbi:MAG: acetoacetate decarboxylase family protein [Thermoplasmata archaeon]